MKSVIENKKVLMWVIIFLLVANLSALVTLIIIFKNNQTNRYPITKKFNSEFKGRSFIENMGLDDEQLHFFQEAKQKHIEEKRHISDEIIKNRLELIEEMSGDNPDLKKLDSLADVIGTLQSDIKKLSYRHFMELKSKCKPEQRDKLNDILDRMIEHEEQEKHGHHGHYKGPGCQMPEKNN